MRHDTRKNSQKVCVSSSRNTVIRNLAIFSFVAVFAGWSGHWLDRATGTPSGDGPGQLLWIVLPVLTGVLLKKSDGDRRRSQGLSFSCAGNGGWYLFALLCSPGCTLVSVFAGYAFGVMRVSISGTPSLVQLVALALLPSFIKNLFEEFAWRGYLTPRFADAGASAVLNHLLTGLVWALWHVPYYLFFLDRQSFAAIAPHGLPVFFAMMVAGVVSLAFVYGELRLLTGSVWPTVVLHTVSNAVTGTMLLQGCFGMAPGADLLVSPLPGSALGIALNMAIWRGLSRSRRSAS
jgi:membrane protease YdiL (CAAX protease family)